MAINYKISLLGLFIGSFAIGTTEFAPMGLLPEIARGVNVSIPQAGGLVSAYAIGVMVGAPLMTWAMHRVSRKNALMLLMLVFAIGNLLTATSGSYWTVLISRLVTSLSHGAFFGIGAVVASAVVPPDKKAMAVAFMFMGLTIANVGGVPAAAWVGQEFGWRLAFGFMPILGFLSIAATWLTLPQDMAISERSQGAQLQVFRSGRVWLALLTTVMGSGSMFSLYTYITPILTEIAGFKVSEVSGALVLVGVGFTVGNVLSGRMADRNLDGTLRFFLVLLAILMLAFPLVVRSLAGALIIIALWGLAAFAVITPLQISVIHAAKDAPALASSLNIGAFNFGNALGAAVGAALIELGLGYDWLPVSGAVMALVALALVLIKAHLYKVDSQGPY